MGYRRSIMRVKFAFAQLLIAACFALVVSCGGGEEYHKPENALDAGREFIQQSLKGKFNLASRYMLQDEDNNYLISKMSEKFSRMSEHDKAEYAKASINIAEVNDVVRDSVTIINYSNSYKNEPYKIKVVKHNGEWLVDFKYTFSGNL